MFRFKNVQRMKDDNATKEVFMKVIYGEGPYGLTIICPTAHMNNWMEDPTDDDSFNENLWQVDKESYDKCAVNVTGKAKENKLLLVCDNKFKKNVMPFIFQKTYGLEDILDVIFEPGKHYYFICKFLRGFDHHQYHQYPRRISFVSAIAYKRNPSGRTNIWMFTPPSQLSRLVSVLR